MKSKAYRASDVKNVEWQRLLEGRAGQEMKIGLDIGKKKVFGVVRWGSGEFERPWRVSNPAEVRLLAERLAWLAQGRRLVVVMEPTGTYGDVLRQAFAQQGLTVHRVSTKMAADFAEIFDGVPSQHDGKDAAVIAELAAQGRSWPWLWQMASEADQELEYLVDWIDAQRRQMVTWLGRSRRPREPALARSDACAGTPFRNAAACAGGVRRPGSSDGRPESFAAAAWLGPAFPECGASARFARECCRHRRRAPRSVGSEEDATLRGPGVGVP